MMNETLSKVENLILEIYGEDFKLRNELLIVVKDCNSKSTFEFIKFATEFLPEYREKNMKFLKLYMSTIIDELKKQKEIEKERQKNIGRLRQLINDAVIFELQSMQFSHSFSCSICSNKESNEKCEVRDNWLTHITYVQEKGASYLARFK